MYKKFRGSSSVGYAFALFAANSHNELGDRASAASHNEPSHDGGNQAATIVMPQTPAMTGCHITENPFCIFVPWRKNTEIKGLFGESTKLCH